jgi:hypothetical protein
VLVCFSQVISEISAQWQQCKLVHGKPRHSQSQGSVERANRDVEDKLACWLRDNKPKTWSIGLPYIQFQKNICHRRGIGRSPYEAMFGCTAKCCLYSLNIPKAILSNVETEEDLGQFLESEQESPPEQPEEPESPKEPCISCGLDACLEDVCSRCSKVVHYVEHCSAPQQQGSTSLLNRRLCLICQKTDATKTARTQSYNGLKRQADKMVENTNKRLKPVSVGSTVLVAIPDVDRGRGDHKNLLGVILSEENTFYKIGTQSGTLKSCYSRNQFSHCEQNFLDVSQVPDEVITLREAARKASSGTGQGFFFCKCTGKCKDQRCKCKKANRICSSKCHNGDQCTNKDD